MAISEKFEAICDEYLAKFVEKHHLDKEECFWVEGRRGEMAYLDGRFVHLREIRFDIDNSIPEKVIWEWYDYMSRVSHVEATYKIASNMRKFAKISFEGWCNGSQLPYSLKELSQMEKDMQRRLEASEKISKFVTNNIKSLK